MKVLKKGLIVVVVIVCLFLLGGFMISPEYDVERSIVIDAPASQVFGPVSTLKEWQQWSAWTTEKYPGLEYEYDGPESGVGSKSSWTDPENGAGRMEITSASETDGIEYTMNFEGFEPSYGRIKFQESAEGTTTVRMGMKGSMGGNPIARYMGLMMDDWMGADFEIGLNGLKTLVESTPSAPATEPPSEDADAESDTTDTPESDVETEPASTTDAE